MSAFAATSYLSYTAADATVAVLAHLREPNVAAEWLVIGVLAYLVLSCRWTYYRLFCYEEMEEWKRAAFDTFIPFLIMAIGALPDTIGFLELLFTGI